MPDAAYKYWPARCSKCKDETKQMRQTLAWDRPPARCLLKTPTGPCKGQLVWVDPERLPKKKLQKARAIEIVGDYDMQRELDRLSAGLGPRE